MFMDLGGLKSTGIPTTHDPTPIGADGTAIAINTRPTRGIKGDVTLIR